MISDQEKLKILEKVLSSEEFNNSPKKKALLKYLVEASIHNKELDEMTIAAEFFHKDSNFAPFEDASIRVYISQLRKRLANYYLSQGKEDKIHIDIPKGQYTVLFGEGSAPYRTNYISTKWIFPIITVCLLFIVIFLWVKYDNLNKSIEIIPRDNPIWAEYLEDNRPILVVLGDYFFMYIDRQGPNPRFNVRDPRINSLEDFKEYSKQGPEGIEDLKPLRHTYLRPSAIWGFMELLPILKSSKSPFFVKQASEIDWEDISSHNVIFIGTFKQLYLLKTLLNNINVEFSLYPNILYLKNKNGEEVQRFSSTLNDETRQYDDVSLIGKFNGPNNNTIMLITGFQEGGVINGSKAIRDPKFLKELLKNNNNELQSPYNFRIILRVQGFLRSELSSKIEYFEVLSEVN